MSVPPEVIEVVHRWVQKAEHDFVAAVWMHTLDLFNW